MHDPIWKVLGEPTKLTQLILACISQLDSTIHILNQVVSGST